MPSPAAKCNFPRTLESESASIIENRIREWLERDLAVPQSALGRPGAVCPFVRPALRASAVRFRTVATTSSPALDVLLEAARQALRDFGGLDWTGMPAHLRCLVVIFPALDEDSGRLLDQVHRELKDDVVASGLMFAQFHPAGTEPSVRNPELIVGRGPVPLLVFRYLAVHDILFLEDQASWFAVYREAYGHRFGTSSTLEPALVAAYARASARFSVTA